MKLNYVAKKYDNGLKLVDVLCNQLGMSRLLTKKLRLYGTVLVNNKHHRMIDPIYEGDKINLIYDEPNKSEPLNVLGRNGIKVLYSDENIIIVDKPAGIVTHHTSNHQSNTLLDHFSELKLHPVSRLDRETSGLIILARDPHSHYRLSVQHKEKTIHKEYLSINHGSFPFTKGKIVAPIKRMPDTIMLRCVAHDGDIAVTNFETVEYFKNLDVSINKFTLETGRTHQIRVHSLFCNNPIISDGLYGANSKDNYCEKKSIFLENEIARQALHAILTSFNHPITNERITIKSDLPKDMENLIQIIRCKEHFFS